MTNGNAVITPLRANRAPGQRWQPFIRDEAIRLMEFKRLPTVQAASDIQQAAARILGFGQDPAHDGQRTGLVVGYVQSGKTLSFTTVIALARDNDIPIVIVVAGTSVPLFDVEPDRSGNGFAKRLRSNVPARGEPACGAFHAHAELRKPSNIGRHSRRD